MTEHERRRLVFEQRRDMLVQGIRAAGLEVPVVPEGAFYVYADIRASGLDAETFCRRLLEEYGVAVTPGTDFGVHEAEQHVRFAFTTDESAIRLGLEQVSQAVDNWKRGA